MRYYTYGVGAALVIELQVAGAVDEIIHDGRDIIHLRLVTGEELMIYLIDSSIPLYEIKNILTENTRREEHTLFMLWCDMLLPDHGQHIRLEDWHEGLLAAFGDKIYAYRIYMQQLYMFPIYFDPIPYMVERKVRYGAPIDVGSIRCSTRETDIPGLRGRWRVANFSGDPNEYYRQWKEEQPLQGALKEYYLLLDIEYGADEDVIKQAYRQMARRYHPDLNPDEGSHAMMQDINRAYRMIMKALKNDSD